MKPDAIHETEDCRMISEMLSRVGDKWSMLVVTVLKDETMRFSVLRRRVGGISQKMLTTTLRNLERDGFVDRTVRPSSPPQVDYRLTPLGQELLAPVAALADWTRANVDRIHLSRALYDAKAEARVQAGTGL